MMSLCQTLKRGKDTIPPFPQKPDETEKKLCANNRCGCYCNADVVVVVIFCAMFRQELKHFITRWNSVVCKSNNARKRQKP
jgi:hypothetical protein